MIATHLFSHFCRFAVVGGLLAASTLVGQPAAFAAKTPPMPDFTAGGQPDKTHDWNLGPTGARGWIWGHRHQTTGAKQILVTRVDKRSPADRVLAVGDVLLGIGEDDFQYDARLEFGRAITAAEATDGKLLLKRWRDGKVSNVEISIDPIGRYAARSPIACPKATKIVEAGLDYIASKPLRQGIPDQINALALLASGDEKYVPIVEQYVKQYARPDLKLKLIPASGMVSWRWSYINLLLTEYYLATGDESVLPAIEEYAVKTAMGQSWVGTWGHAMAWPAINDEELHGRLPGYGALNQAGLVCHLSLVMAKKCGVDHPEVNRAVDKANTFFSFYTGKGAIPYGDHAPRDFEHDDNGKCSIAAVIFDLQGMHEEAQFFSRMAVASYPERELGHTGNYFSFLWGPLGANRAGTPAAAAFLNELRGYFDLARTWEGRFVYQGGAGMSGSEHKYGNWDCTGAYLLAYQLPKRKLYITGRDAKFLNPLVGDELTTVVESGRGYTIWDKGAEYYGAMDTPMLLTKLESWSPPVRHRAATALGKRNATDAINQLTAMLKSGDLNTRLGACQALGALKQNAAPAIPALVETLAADNFWLRSRAADALRQIGEPALIAVPELLKVAAELDQKNDPRQMLQRDVARTLFYRGGVQGARGLISRDLDGVDREALYQAVKVVLQNPDGRTRSNVGSIFDRLSLEQLQPIIPDIVRAIKEPAPSGIMFADGIRLNGLDLLARHNLAIGLELAVPVIELNRWGARTRVNRVLKTIEKYGGNAKPIIPQLEEVVKQLDNDRQRSRTMQEERAKILKLIEMIKADQNPPALVELANMPSATR